MRRKGVLRTATFAATENNWMAWTNLGTAYVRAGKPLQAVAACREGLRINRYYPVAWNTLGTAYGGLGQHGQARECFREAVALKPDYAQAWYNLGLANAALGRREEAFQALRKLQRLDRTMADDLADSLR